MFNLSEVLTVLLILPASTEETESCHRPLSRSSRNQVIDGMDLTFLNKNMRSPSTRGCTSLWRERNIRQRTWRTARKSLWLRIYFFSIKKFPRLLPHEHHGHLHGELHEAPATAALLLAVAWKKKLWEIPQQFLFSYNDKKNNSHLEACCTRMGARRTCPWTRRCTGWKSKSWCTGKRRKNVFFYKK